jgi:hypothetical protein
MPPSYPNGCDVHPKTTVQNACFDRIFGLVKHSFYRRRRTRSERGKSSHNRRTFYPDLLRKRARRNAHDKDPVFDHLDTTVLSDHRINDARPQLSGAIDESQIDSTKTSRQRVEKVAQWRWIVACAHEVTSDRSITAAGESAPGSGDAVVTNVWPAGKRPRSRWLLAGSSSLKTSSSRSNGSTPRR